jgi:hypothetical protein
MSNVVFIPSAILGLVLVALYCFRCWILRADINVGVIINIVLSSAGLVAGAVIAASTVYEPLRKAVADLNLYILISGLAVVAVSVQTLWRDFGFRRAHLFDRVTAATETDASESKHETES